MIGSSMTAALTKVLMIAVKGALVCNNANLMHETKSSAEHVDFIKAFPQRYDSKGTRQMQLIWVISNLSY